jgi:hypothetical protein
LSDQQSGIRCVGYPGNANIEPRRNLPWARRRRRATDHVGIRDTTARDVGLDALRVEEIVDRRGAEISAIVAEILAETSLRTL